MCIRDSSTPTCAGRGGGTPPGEGTRERGPTPLTCTAISHAIAFALSTHAGRAACVGPPGPHEGRTVARARAPTPCMSARTRPRCVPLAITGGG
eukprot:6444028-Alexandrium_andersonii.AAC.1